MKVSGFMCYKFYDRLLLSLVSFMQLQIFKPLTHWIVFIK